MTPIDLIFIFAAKYLIFILAALALYWFVRMSREDQVKMLRFGTISLPLTYALGFIASLLYYDPRPFISGNITPLIAHAANNGFPSDHALASFAIAAVFFAFSRPQARMLFILATIVAFARVFVGVHHYLDIEASLILALVGWQATNLLMKRYERKFFKRP
jgi:undecaprenyl-diphosphatase